MLVVPLPRLLWSLKNCERSLGLSERLLFCSSFATKSKKAYLKAELKSCDEVLLRKPTVIALSLPDRPLIPGLTMAILVKEQDGKLLKDLVKSRENKTSFVGAFLLKDKTGADARLDSELVSQFTGKELFNRLYEVGTLAEITRIKKDLVFLRGHRRIKIIKLESEEPLTVQIGHLKDNLYEDDNTTYALYSEVVSVLSDVIDKTSCWRELCDHVPRVQTTSIVNYSRLADSGPSIVGANKFQFQEVLEELDVYKRLNLTLELSKKAMELHGKKKKDKNSGEQQLTKTTEKKIGQGTYALTKEKFRQRIDQMKDKCPPPVLQVINEELTKFKRLKEGSTRDYLDYLTALPWGNYSDENFDVAAAQKILDEEHYGLSDVKERILEFVAVGKLRGTAQGKILCLSGPPGTEKTSIVRSIARALNRKFYAFPVGGLSDVDEIKGHNRTYIGATPGKMVKCLKSTGTANPLILIDEIDKLGEGWKGDPVSALLEHFDPEQNGNFMDNYLDVPIDLSKALFVCTANDVEHIKDPLLDRMEVIHIDGYVTDEKMHIARYMEKATQLSCGIKPEQVEVTDAALLTLVEKYCREAGVRNLKKQIEKIYRKIALRLVRKLNDHSAVAGDFKNNSETMEKQEKGYSEAVKKITVDASNLYDFVGLPDFDDERIYDHTPIGVAMGLAWTRMGGTITYIETTLIEEYKGDSEGKGVLKVTGQLGSVMKESAQIAHTVARAIMLEKEPDNKFFANAKLHLHAPEGATPKDGPSAGCTMITSLLSLAMKKPVKKDLAMTGEVTLTGKIRPIGGVKEKVIAAKRSGVKTVIFPSDNKADLDEIAPNIKEGLDVQFVQDYSQIFEIAFSEEQHIQN